MTLLQQLSRNIRDARVLEAMRVVPREAFVPQDQRYRAQEDSALPIGFGQTISQPYIVAFMTECLRLKPTDRVLEIGTGSGYQAAVLSRLVQDVYTIEIVEPLARDAIATLQGLGYDNVHFRIGDGHAGWPEAAPFDAIIVTCAPENVPPALLDQLREGGRMIVPVGPEGDVQNLHIIRKEKGGIQERTVLQVRFVPMTGREGEPGAME